jgi:hypothetical protein
MQLITGRFVSAAVGVVAKLGIADMLASGPKTADDMAKRADVHAESLYRVLRMLSMVGVLVETEPHTFALTPVGDTLRSNVPGSMLGMALWITSPTNYQCWGELMYSVKTGQPAADTVLGMPVFEYLFHENPDVGEVFNNAMTAFATESHSTAVEAYNFGDFKKVIDVGGGHGALMSAILKANPGVYGVVFDLPEVVAGAGKLLSERGVADRCETVGGDFFQSVPSGGDAYVSSVVIHDWSDEKAAIILSNIRQAMNPGAKVLLVEAVIPHGNDPHPGKVIDLEMLVMTPGGRERTANQFATLFAMAGLKLTRIVPTQSYTSVIEAEAA